MKENTFLSKFKRGLNKKSGVLIAELILVIFFAVFTEKFFTINNLITICQQVSIYALVAFGITFVLITGGIDLSAGAVIGLSGIVCAMIVNSYHNVVYGIIAAVFVGFLCGCLNGVIITRLKLVPFIITLGTQYIFRGMVYLLNNGSPSSIRAAGDFVGMKWFGQLGIGRLGGIIPYIILIMVTVGLICNFILKRTKYARELYSVGSNLEAARLSGVNTVKVTCWAYMICAVICSLDGILLVARMSTAQVDAGVNYELEGIAAAVMGGVSASGGTGDILGAFMGALIVGTLRNGLNQMGIGTFMQKVIIGIVIILAVYIDKIRSSSPGGKHPFAVKKK